MNIVNISDLVKDTPFRPFSNTVQDGGKVLGICVPEGASRLSRKDIDDFEQYLSSFLPSSTRIHWLKDCRGVLKGPVERFIPLDLMPKICYRFRSESGDLLIMIPGTSSIVSNALEKAKTYIKNILKLC